MNRIKQCLNTVLSYNRAWSFRQSETTYRDGILSKEKLSYNAFNEKTRLMHCISLPKDFINVKVKNVAKSIHARARETHIARNILKAYK